MPSNDASNNTELVIMERKGADSKATEWLSVWLYAHNESNWKRKDVRKY